MRSIPIEPRREWLESLLDIPISRPYAQCTSYAPPIPITAILSDLQASFLWAGCSDSHRTVLSTNSTLLSNPIHSLWPQQTPETQIVPASFRPSDKDTECTSYRKSLCKNTFNKLKSKKETPELSGSSRTKPEYPHAEKEE